MCWSTKRLMMGTYPQDILNYPKSFFENCGNIRIQTIRHQCGVPFSHSGGFGSSQRGSRESSHESVCASESHPALLQWVSPLSFGDCVRVAFCSRLGTEMCKGHRSIGTLVQSIRRLDFLGALKGNCRLFWPPTSLFIRLCYLKKSPYRILDRVSRCSPWALNRTWKPAIFLPFKSCWFPHLVHA